MKDTLAIGLKLSGSVESSPLRLRTGTRIERFCDSGRTVGAPKKGLTDFGNISIKGKSFLTEEKESFLLFFSAATLSPGILLIILPSNIHTVNIHTLYYRWA